MVDSMQNGVGICFSIKYACTSEKNINLLCQRKKKQFLTTFFVQNKNGGDILFVSLYETTTTQCDASVCCLWKEGNSAL